MIAHSILPEFDQEMARTRKTLERLPAEKLAWKPHEKSMTMGQLATHLINVPTWGQMVLTTPELDINPEGKPLQQPPLIKSIEEALKQFDENVATFRTTLAKSHDETFLENWSLIANGTKIFTMRRLACIRSMVLNHMIHHRAQLGVYYRLNDIPVPALYGPSADEQQ